MENNTNEPSSHDEREHESSKYFRVKKFHLIMMLFLTVLLTAGISIFALSFGDEKVATVGVPERVEFTKLYDAYDQINENYFQDVEEEDLVNGAINGMIEAIGDPYSDYMNQDEASQFNESISSSFQGIGAEIQSLDGMITVVSPIKGSPAEEAGILPNDQILAVDDESIQGMSANEAVMLIRGEKGTEVKLTIQRSGMNDPINVTIVRDDIPIETVYYEMNDDNVATIQLTSFAETTATELTEAIEDLESQGMEALVLDLRGNPGGLLSQAEVIANLFVPAGEPIVQIESKDGNRSVIEADGGQKLTLPTAVLIDEGSASASEIVAAALNEAADIPLVGQTSFGKGTVQTATEFADQSNIKLTTQRWLTPDGNWIHEEGIKPTVEVALPDYAYLPMINTEVELEESMLSEDIKVAEQMLAAIGFEPGEQDGLFDEETQAAVEAFQEEKELEVTGTINEDTALAIMLELRTELQENDPQVEEAVKLLLGEEDQPAEEESEEEAS